MDGLQVFANSEFGKIRTVVFEEKIWFVGVDVARALGYNKPSNAISKYVAQNDKVKEVIEALPRNGAMVKTQTNLINESGLYSLILSSKLPQAKEFKRWVTSEVLPSIRETGSYDVMKPVPVSLPEQKAETEAVSGALPLLQEFNKTLQLAHRLQRDCSIKADKVLRMAQNMLERGVR